MEYTIVIPARYQSSRLPGKPLADIAGKPMIQRVYERATKAEAARVIVATDDQRIVEAVQSFGGDVMMTSTQHLSGTDRLEEVARNRHFVDDHIIVNLQGDEPLLSVKAIEQVANNIANNRHCGIATLCEKIDSDDDIANPNIVKVVRDERNRALYFSRAPIPFKRRAAVQYFRHIGIYAYRVSVLHQFVNWEPSAIEQAESLEQLRALYHGVSIHCDDCIEPVPGGVDTPEDLARIRAQFEHH